MSKKLQEIVAFVDEDSNEFCIGSRDGDRRNGALFVGLTLPLEDLMDYEPEDLERRIGGTILALLQIARGKAMGSKDYKQT